MKKIISLTLILSMLAGLAIPLSAATGGSKVDYTIVNPYESVDWSNARTFKACLHAHSNASDGENSITDTVMNYYNAGYDIFALTDHGVVNPGWDKDRRTNGIFNGFAEVKPMSAEDYAKVTTGSDRNGRGMVDVTGGIECNMAVVSKVHVNGYFTTYGQGVWGRENDYSTAAAGIEKAGGYSVLNHVGDWVNSPNFPERSHNPFYINYFAQIFDKYHTCLGLEIINNTDNCTRGDRELWDELLQVIIPRGRNIWGFADDDSEYTDEVGRSFELFPLTENNMENVKNAMAKGAFFAASKYCKNTARKDEFEGDGLVPLVTNIAVDNDADSITVEVDSERGCDSIEWIADGKVICRDYTINLNDYDGSLGCYVRFVLKSAEHGVTYSQAFELKYAGRADKPIPDSPIPDNIFGKIFWLWYKRLSVALADLILEKILDKAGIIPKIAE